MIRVVTQYTFFYSVMNVGALDVIIANITFNLPHLRFHTDRFLKFNLNT